MPKQIDLPLSYELCRAIGHRWSVFTPDRERPRWGVLFALVCDRCTMERHDVLDGRGTVSHRGYRRPGDYKLDADDVPTRDELRRDLVAKLGLNGKPPTATTVEQRRARARVRTQA